MTESIIIDNGSNTCKAGFSEDDMPRVEIPTVLGIPISLGGEDEEKGNKEQEDEEINQLDIFVGEEAISKGGILDLKNPIKNGIIEKYDIMKKIWNHIFYNELLADTKSYPVIVSESPHSPYHAKIEMAKVLFEELNVEQLYITNTSTLALYANGRTTGIVVDVGYSMTSCVPIFEGFVLAHAKNQIELGGKKLTDFLSKLVNDRIQDKSSWYVNDNEKAMINEVKEKICIVAEDYDSEFKKIQDIKKTETYVFPEGSGRKIEYSVEKFQCPELLFQPNLNLEDSSGIHELCYKSISKCDLDIVRDLYLNTILCGGSTLFMKIQNRFHKELQSLAPTGKNVNIIAPPERKYSAWLGGSILASLENFRKTMFVSKKDYTDSGAEVIYNKFF
jgi:actin